MSHFLPLVAAIFLLLALFFQGAVSLERYVSSQGGADANNDCATAALPCASVGHAVNISGPDDEVLLSEGTHVIDKDVMLTQSITIRPLNDGVAPVITAAASAVYLFRVDYQNYNKSKSILEFNIFGPLEISGVYGVLFANAGDAWTQQHRPVRFRFKTIVFTGVRKYLTDITFSAGVSYDELYLEDIVVQDCVVERLRSDDRSFLSAIRPNHANLKNVTFLRITARDETSIYQPYLIRLETLVEFDGVFVRESNISSIFLYIQDHGTLRNVEFDKCVARPKQYLIQVEQIPQGPRARVKIGTLRTSQCSGDHGLRFANLFDVVLSEFDMSCTTKSLVEFVNSVVSIDNSVFDGNNGTAESCVSAFDCTLQVRSSTFRNCKSEQAGGALTAKISKLVVSGSTFYDNSAVSGGAIAFIYPVFDSIKVNGFTGNQFFRNTASTGDGGAILVVRQYLEKVDYMQSYISIAYNTFEENSAGNAGGAVALGGVGIVFTANTLTLNSAQTGGAVLCDDGAEVNLLSGAKTRSRFSRNRAVQGGAFATLSCALRIKSLEPQSLPTIFEYNGAHKYGGAIFARNARDITGDKQIILCQKNNAGIAGGCVFFGKESTSTVDLHSAAQLFGEDQLNQAGNYGNWLASWPLEMYIRPGEELQSPRASEPVVVPLAPFLFSVEIEAKDGFASTVSGIPLIAALSMTGSNCSESILTVAFGAESTTIVFGLQMLRCPSLSLSMLRVGALDDTSSTHLNASMRIRVDTCPFGYIVKTEHAADITTYECTRILEIVAGTAVGIVLLFFLVILAISAIIFAVIQFVKRIRREEQVQKLLGNGNFVRLYDIGDDDGLPMQLHGLRSRGLVLDPSEIRILDLIANGAQASVFKAEYSGEPIAIKLFPLRTVLGDADADISAFESEVAILQNARHPCVLQLMGVVCFGNKIGLCLELMQGSLASLIVAFGVKHADGNSLRIGWSLKRHILQQIAKGMTFLHWRKIAHRDLKPENVLISGIDLDDSNKTNAKLSQVVVKLADFGHAKAFLDNSMMHTLQVGTAAYLPPEVGRDYGSVQQTTAGSIQSDGASYVAKYDLSCDMYSFGILIYCVLMETTRPYGDLGDVDIITQVRRKGRRPVIDDTAYLNALKLQTEREIIAGNLSKSQQQSAIIQAHQVLQLMRRCWAQDPSERPSFPDVVASLNS